MILKRYKDFIIESKEELWIYDGNFFVDSSMYEDRKLIKDKIPDIINGNFNCSKKYITSLEGCPTEVYGSFDCSHNELITLKGLPRIIKGDLNIGVNLLTSLEGCPKEVYGGFYCNRNNLSNLKGCPIKISEDFSVHANQLTSLEGCPREIKEFECWKNELTSLEGGPDKVLIMDVDKNPLLSLEYHPKEITKRIYSSLRIESRFVNDGHHKNNYWNDLLKYMIKEKIDLTEVKGWPEGFLTDETIRSVKGISKFKL